MHKTFLKFVGTYATYSDIFGFKMKREDIITFIDGLPLAGILNITSQLNHITIDDKKIRKNYYDHSENVGLDKKFIADKLNNRILYSEQGVLSLWKWLLGYGDEKKLCEQSDILRGTNQIITLLMAISDYLFVKNDENEDKINYELFCNMAFNSNGDYNSLIARAGYIYEDLAMQYSIYNPKEYLNFNKDFKVKYGYTIKEYLSVIFAISIVFNNKTTISTHWTKSLSNFLSNTLLNDKAKVIIEPLAFTFNEGKEWAIETINEPWNYSLFQKKPLFYLNDGGTFPVSRKLVCDQMFEELFNKIRNIYPDNDTNFNRFFGRPFETYAGHYMEEAIEQSKIPYEYIPEFSYSNKRSPDILLKLGNKLLAIEVKSKRLKFDSKVYGNKSSIDEDINRMIIDPLLQVGNRLYELKESDHEIMSGVDEIYIMVVNMGSVPTLQPFEIKINEKLRNESKIMFKFYYHLDIEEYELMCYQIGRKNSHPIFRLLDNKARLFPFNPFKNYIVASHLPSKRLDSFQKIFINRIYEISRMLFPGHE